MNFKCLFSRLLALIFFLSLFTSVFAEGNAANGKTLFKSQCASCHNKNMKNKLTGPPLGGTQERWAEYPKSDLYDWIRNAPKMIEDGHPRAKELWAEYKPNQMNLFPNLTDQDIDDLLLYVDNMYEFGCASPPCPVVASSDTASTKGGSGVSKWLYWLLFGVLGILALVLTRIVSNLNYMADLKEGATNVQRKTLVDILTSRGVVTFVLFALVVLGGYTTVNNAIAFGRQQGYAPEQPINFSHKLHAGVHKIDCQYCHDGARRSKHAVIPATNTCMNCHEAVQEGPSGTKEIAKIYDAAGWDVEKQKYTGEEKPIEWVKIHNLPDHVYFNHAQHVVAGKVACQTCHGDVEEMDVLEQYAPLSMGWCVNCHRETKVDFDDNEYYQVWEKYHKDKKEGVTVEDIGGLECQKCHY